MTHLEGIGEFGDVRRAERGAWLFDRIVATGSLVLRKVGGDRAGEMAAHRFVDSHAVTAGEIIETLGIRTGERCRGRRIIAVQDTSEINFSGRARARRGLSWWCGRRKTGLWLVVRGCLRSPPYGRCWANARSKSARAVQAIRGVRPS